MKCSLGISDFLGEIYSLCYSLVFLYFFALITEEGFLISPCYSLELCIQMDIPFFFSLAFCFSSQLFGRPPQTTILPFCIFFLGDGFDHHFLFWCHETPSIVLQALCLSDRIPWFYLSLLLYNCKGIYNHKAICNHCLIPLHVNIHTWYCSYINLLDYEGDPGHLGVYHAYGICIIFSF